LDSQPEGHTNVYSDPNGQFTLIAARSHNPRTFLQMDAYSAAKAFIQGEFDIHGNIFEAIRHFSRHHHSPLRQFLFSQLARLERLRIASVLGFRGPAARSIQFHYDRSNEFYSQFLDSRMIYSAAYFSDPEASLEEAQSQKLDRLCRDLVLRPDDHLLDIGCGWGGFITYAAQHFKVRALGCTLATQQLTYAQQLIEQHCLSNNVSVQLCDYRDLKGSFDRIASIGMFEHVGHARLPKYCQKVLELLKPGGLFLNRGVVRPHNVTDGPETLFIQKVIFPGAELVHLDDVIREGERAGLGVIGMRDLRRHYALTCQAWTKNLEKSATRCRELVGDTLYRTWLLYLAGSAIAFETSQIGAAQVLFSKPRS
jgi:cyclopropane-fatty-acyl-phospholipid synthase